MLRRIDRIAALRTRLADDPFAMTAVAAVILVGCSFLSGLGGYGILDNNEGLYAEIPREMLLLKQYVVPHLNFVPYIEKPPLLYWLIALSYAIFGENEFAARLVPALAAMGTCGVAFWLGHREGRKAEGLVAVLVMASSIAFVVVGRTVFFESLLTLTMSAALACLYLFLKDGNKLHLRAACVWLALAVMTKGFVALLLPTLVVLVYLATIHAPARRYLDFFTDLPALALFLAIAAPWHIFAAVQVPDFAWFYFINEHLNRFIGLREPRDYYGGPIWYYLPRLFTYLAPWSLVLPWSLRAAWQSKEPLDRFLLIWLTTFLVFFSLSSNKANYYLVTATVPMALLVARTMAQWIEEEKFARLGIVGALWGLGFLCALLTLGADCTQASSRAYPTCLAATPATIGAFVAYLAALSAVMLLFKRRDHLGFAVVAALIFPTLLTAQTIATDNENAITERNLVGILAGVDDGRPLYFAGKFEDTSSTLFYRKSRLRIVIDTIADNNSADLAYGAKHAKPGWFVEMADFATIATRKPVYLLLNRRTGPYFLERIAPSRFCSIGESDRLMLMTNVPEDCRG
ncbi:glycosyltransferase family 39 protein [Parvibaculum sp.]|uniref:glycosyltransferase family 39 protein n=1 Tax=Parvibaculum sp. TaxID=2024848 RepID=UPI002C70A78A|nr:glycosyltransferase family 39 protein [Parvibaculum sp.]HUD50335.1 glycosyltransferase family 39 protein [Parvibaculum sp.]